MTSDSELPISDPGRVPAAPRHEPSDHDPDDESGIGELARIRVAAADLISRIRWFARVILSSGDRFYRDDGFQRAASLAYTSLLSLMPVTVLGFGILASFAITEDYIKQVRGFLFRQFVPNDQFVNDVLFYIQGFSDAVNQLNVVFIMFLVITSLLLINSVEYALNATWQVFEPRPIAQRIAIFSAIILIAPVLLLSAYYFYEKIAYSHFLLESGLFVRLYQNLVPFFIDLVAFVLLYWLVPKAPVRLQSAIFGAIIAALLFDGAKFGFALYLKDFATYNTLYKSLAAVPIFLVWLYLSWIILLFGAEVSYQVQYMPRSGKLWKRSVLSVGDARMMLAIQSLVLVARAFQNGARMPNDIELAEFLGCSNVVLKPIIDSLEKAGIVARGDSRDMPITLLMSPDRITVQHVRVALFGERASVHFPQEMQRLFLGLAGKREPTAVTLAHVLGGRDGGTT